MREEGAILVWAPDAGARYWYVTSVPYGKPEVSSSTLTRYQVEEYAYGNFPHVFKSEADAMEAAKRCWKVCEELHVELGY